MKNLFRMLLSTMVILFCLTGCAQSQIQNSVEILPTMETQSDAVNRVWVGTFQIVWNQLMDNIVYGPVEFADYTSKVAQDLNKRSFSTADISADSYYTKYGYTTPKMKKEIETDIKKKFNEKSDILDSFAWSKKSKNILIYAMLKKDFKFLTPFDKLHDATFGKISKNEVKYFGINSDTKKSVRDNVEVMFYDKYNDFAVKLLTKGNDYVLLYRTDDDKTFDEYYKDLMKKNENYKGDRKFSKLDEFKVPDISMYQETSFEELEGHKILKTDYVIDKTIETIDFNMNNTGVKLKSEAAIMMKLTALPIEEGRYFMFTDRFVLFLIEKDKTTPYYAMKIDDVASINKTARK